ncbi:hypothetical protein GCM10011428_52640 [Streptomyces violaceus]
MYFARRSRRSSWPRTFWFSMASESPRYSTRGALAGARGLGETGARWCVVVDTSGADGGDVPGPDDGSPHAPSSSPASRTPTIHGPRIRQLPPRPVKRLPRQAQPGPGRKMRVGHETPVVDDVTACQARSATISRYWKLPFLYAVRNVSSMPVTRWSARLRSSQ